MADAQHHKPIIFFVGDDGKTYARANLENYPRFQRQGGGFNSAPLTDAVSSKINAEFRELCAELTKEVTMEHVKQAIRAELTKTAMNELSRYRDPGTPGRGNLLCPTELSYSADEFSNFQDNARPCYHLTGAI